MIKLVVCILVSLMILNKHGRSLMRPCHMFLVVFLDAFLGVFLGVLFLDRLPLPLLKHYR